jgi:GntR family transcriptional regulator
VDDDRPIYLQVAELIEEQILDGSLPEEGQVPSINELAAFHRINPATALKGINRLVDSGVLYKRRGIGMFVASGARQHLLAVRRQAFTDQYIRPLLDEAFQIGMTSDDVVSLITREAER